MYGAPERTPITEDQPLRPINPYGDTKRAFEGMLNSFTRAYGMAAVSLRYFNAAGATDKLGEDHRPETHLIPNILAAVEQGAPIEIFGSDYPTSDGTCVRDYVHVDDLAAGPRRRSRVHGRSGERTQPAQPWFRRRLLEPPGAARCGIGRGTFDRIRHAAPSRR